MCQEPGTKTKYIFLIITEADADENGLGPPISPHFFWAECALLTQVMLEGVSCPED